MRVRRGRRAVRRPGRGGDDGRSGRGTGRARRPGVATAAPPMERRPVRVRASPRHVETLVVGGGPAGDGGGERRRGSRRSRDARRGERTAGRRAGAGRRAPSSATALGVYDDGYVVVHERIPAGRTSVARACAARGARDGCARAAHRVRGQRPARRDARRRPLATFLDRFGVLPGERAVVFTTNHSGHDAAVRAPRGGRRRSRSSSTGKPEDRRRRGSRCGASTSRNGWAVAGTDGDPRLSAVHLLGPDGSTRDTIAADVLLVSGGWNPVVQLWRAIGGGLRYDEPRACFVPDGNGPRWLSVVGAAAGEVPDVRSVLVRACARTTRGTSSTSSATRRSRTCCEAVHARSPLGRARQAGDVHRHRGRPGTHVGRADRRDREPGARRRTGRARPDRRPTAVHPGLVRGARGARPRPSLRSGPRDADPRVARRTRRRVRERRVSGSGRGTSQSGRPRRWTRRSSARASPSAPASA